MTSAPKPSIAALLTPTCRSDRIDNRTEMFFVHEFHDEDTN